MSANLRILIFTPDPRVECPRCSSSDWKGTVVEIMYERVAAIDVGKKEVAVTVRVPGKARGTRTQQTRKFRTFYQVLRQMVGWLVGQGVTQVAMEATGVYWKPIFHALREPDTLEVVLVNARHVKNVPGRSTRDGYRCGSWTRTGDRAGSTRYPPSPPIPCRGPASRIAERPPPSGCRR